MSATSEFGAREHPVAAPLDERAHAGEHDDRELEVREHVPEPDVGVGHGAAR